MQFESVLYVRTMADARRVKLVLLAEARIEPDAPVTLERMGSRTNRWLSAMGIHRSTYEVVVRVTHPTHQIEAVKRLAQDMGAGYDDHFSKLLFKMDSDTLEYLDRLVAWDENMAKVPGLIDHTKEA